MNIKGPQFLFYKDIFISIKPFFRGRHLAQPNWDWVMAMLRGPLVPLQSSLQHRPQQRAQLVLAAGPSSPKELSVGHNQLLFITKCSTFLPGPKHDAWKNFFENDENVERPPFLTC